IIPGLLTRVSGNPLLRDDFPITSPHVKLSATTPEARSRIKSVRKINIGLGLAINAVLFRSYKSLRLEGGDGVVVDIRRLCVTLKAGRYVWARDFITEGATMNTGYESRRLHRFSLILLGCSLAIPVLMGCARTQALAEEEEIDDDTVMIPYSKIDKDDLTYSVTQLDQEDIERRHVRRVEELLEGRVSGVNVIERSGGRITVQIRGV